MRRRRHDTSITDERPQRLGQQQHQQDQEHAVVNRQEPENRPPAERARNGAAQDRPDGDGDQQPALVHAHEAAALGARGDVANDAGANGNGARAARALQAAQDDERGVVARQGEADAGAEKDGKGAEVGDAAAADIGHGTPEAGRNGLENEIGCDGEVDEIDGDVEVGGYGGQGWKVNVGSEAGDLLSSFVRRIWINCGMLRDLFYYVHVAAKEAMKTISHFCLLSNIVYGGSGAVAAGRVASRASLSRCEVDDMCTTM